MAPIAHLQLAAILPHCAHWLSGWGALSARSLADALGSSPRWTSRSPNSPIEIRRAESPSGASESIAQHSSARVSLVVRTFLQLILLLYQQIASVRTNPQGGGNDR
jgi:hypothetical protein